MKKDEVLVVNDEWKEGDPPTPEMIADNYSYTEDTIGGEPLLPETILAKKGDIRRRLTEPELRSMRRDYEWHFMPMADIEFKYKLSRHTVYVNKTKHNWKREIYRPFKGTKERILDVIRDVDASVSDMTEEELKEVEIRIKESNLSCEAAKARTQAVMANKIAQLAETAVTAAECRFVAELAKSMGHINTNPQGGGRPLGSLKKSKEDDEDNKFKFPKVAVPV